LANENIVILSVNEGSLFAPISCEGRLPRRFAPRNDRKKMDSRLPRRFARKQSLPGIAVPL